LVDVGVSAVSGVALLPVAGAIAAAVRVDSAGPALFRQVRVGRDGERFEMLKFRTMVVDAARRGPALSGSRDPRVTRVGRFLRATKLDELPQLWNVLRGDMTLVGPRAEVPELLAHYRAAERQVLAVRPGLTGAGQLYFTLHQAAELDDVADPFTHHVERQLPAKIALDLAYIRQQTWWRDLALVLTTAGVVVGLRTLRLAPTCLRHAGQRPAAVPLPGSDDLDCDDDAIVRPAAV
jgi:lipopolysaccharide/colanic/teichoic acid biosynthesis glycosyltransferase